MYLRARQFPRRSPERADGPDRPTRRDGGDGGDGGVRPPSAPQATVALPEFPAPPEGGGAGTGLLALLDGPAVAALFGFFAFLPYPAVPYGAHSAVQTGNLFALLLVVPCLLLPWNRQPFPLAFLLVIPVVLSLLKVAATGGDLDLCFKSCVATAFSGVALLAAQRVAPRQALPLMTGIACATALHVVVGFWQLYAFDHGELPLLSLYVNPSFLSVQENAPTIVRYIRRPFGLFPEPSAMSSSLAPWALFWLAEAFGLVRLRQGLTPRRRAFFVATGAGAVALIILSRSGHAMVTLAALAVFAGAWAVRSRATPRTYLTLLAVFCLALPLVLWAATAALSERVGGGSAVGDDSWHDRAASLRVGFSLVTDGGVGTWIFGMGPGLTSPAIRSAARYEAVWSVLLPYAYQTGLVGAACLAAIGGYLAVVWRATGFALAFAAILSVWLVGVTVTTSYSQLLPLWVALGWLSAWPAVCEPRVAGPALFPALPRRGRPRGPRAPRPAVAHPLPGSR